MAIRTHIVKKITYSKGFEIETYSKLFQAILEHEATQDMRNSDGVGMVETTTAALSEVLVQIVMDESFSEEEFQMFKKHVFKLQLQGIYSVTYDCF
jgi:hypothetical protein